MKNYLGILPLLLGVACSARTPEQNFDHFDEAAAESKLIRLIGRIDAPPRLPAKELRFTTFTFSHNEYGSDDLLNVEATTPLGITRIQFAICIDNTTCDPTKEKPGQTVFGSFEYPGIKPGVAVVYGRPCQEVQGEVVCDKWKQKIDRQTIFADKTKQKLMLQRYEAMDAFWDHCTKIYASLQSHKKAVKRQELEAIDQLRNNLINLGIDRCVFLAQTGRFGLIERVLLSDVHPEWRQLVQGHEDQFGGLAVLLVGGRGVLEDLRSDAEARQAEVRAKEVEKAAKFRLARGNLKPLPYNPGAEAMMVRDLQNYQGRWFAGLGPQGWRALRIGWSRTTLIGGLFAAGAYFAVASLGGFGLAESDGETDQILVQALSKIRTAMRATEDGILALNDQLVPAK